MKKKTKVYVKGKEGKKFWEELQKNRQKITKYLNPRVCYTKDYDMFSICWGDKKIESTIETNLLGAGDLRFDITKDRTIVGIEIENLTDVLKKFNCDKNERGAKK